MIALNVLDPLLSIVSRMELLAVLAWDERVLLRTDEVDGHVDVMDCL